MNRGGEYRIEVMSRKWRSTTLKDEKKREKKEGKGGRKREERKEAKPKPVILQVIEQEG